MRRAEKRMREAAEAAAHAELLLPDDAGGYLEAEGLERTYKFTQEQIRPHLDVTSAKKVFFIRRMIFR
jgi:U3 small nucleolar RNA-associated protein 7